MGKGRRNQRNLDYYKVQGGAVEDRDVGRAAKQHLATQEKTRAKKPSPADVHPVRKKKAGPKVSIHVKSTLAPKPRVAPKPPKPRAAAKPRVAPKPVAGAAVSRGLTQRAIRAAEMAIGALRWAGHQIQVFRGKKEIS